MDFIITGLPRCKTAWLAAFFTQKGSSQCWHEVLAEIGLEAATKLHETKANLFQGCSDSGVLICHEPFIKAYPNTKWIHVDRNASDVFASGVKAGIARENIEFACDMQEEFLDIMTGKPNFMRLPFDFTEEQLMDACAFIGIAWDQKHYDFLKRFNIQMSQHHVDFLDLSNAGK